jgi:hypothetical protein
MPLKILFEKSSEKSVKFFFSHFHFTNLIIHSMVQSLTIIVKKWKFNTIKREQWTRRSWTKFMVFEKNSVGKFYEISILKIWFITPKLLHLWPAGRCQKHAKWSLYNNYCSFDALLCISSTIGVCFCVRGVWWLCFCVRGVW